MTGVLGTTKSYLKNIVLASKGAGTVFDVEASSTLSLTQNSSGSKVTTVAVSHHLVIAQNALGDDDTGKSVSDFLILSHEVDLYTTLRVKHCNVFNDWPVHKPRRNMKLISLSATGFREPAQLCVVGETIRFTNHTEDTHTITGPFDTFDLAPGANKEVALTKAGTFPIASNKFAQKGSLNVQT